MTEKLQAFVEEQQAKLEALMSSPINIFNEIQPPVIKYTLRKLPMWGEKVTPDMINFQWPTQ